MVARRDPVSELFDGPARRLLERAYAQRGQWVSTRVADPGPRHVAWAAGRGINVLGRDNASTRSGRHQDMRTRWVRAYVRALYYQHKWFSPTSGTVMRSSRRTVAAPHGALEVRVGRRLNVLGVLPAGRQVEVRIRAGGETARRAVYKLDESERIWTGDGQAGGRFAEISGRDWLNSAHDTNRRMPQLPPHRHHQPGCCRRPSARLVQPHGERPARTEPQGL